MAHLLAWLDVLSGYLRGDGARASFGMRGFQPRRVPAIVLPIATAALAVAIFVLDTITDMEIAIAVFYVVVVLLSVRFLTARQSLLVTAACIALTLLSFFLTQKGAIYSGLINCAISCTAILTSSYLVLKADTAEIAARQARAQLEEAARLAALGALGVSIAHEIAQPLTGIATSAEAGLRWLEGNPANIERAQLATRRIMLDANRANDIVVRMRRFARKSPTPGEQYNMNALVREVGDLLVDQVTRQNIAMELHLDPSVPDSTGDRVQIQQVVLNLVLNAADAMSELPRHAYRSLVVKTQPSTEGGVLVEVADTGAGLSSKTAEQVFDAFFTTKPRGLGVGLAISRSIVEAHGGKIWIERSDASGTVFRFHLPAYQVKSHEH